MALSQPITSVLCGTGCGFYMTLDSCDLPWQGQHATFGRRRILMTRTRGGSVANFRVETMGGELPLSR